MVEGLPSPAMVVVAICPMESVLSAESAVEDAYESARSDRERCDEPARAVVGHRDLVCGAAEPSREVGGSRNAVLGDREKPRRRCGSPSAKEPVVVAFVATKAGAVMMPEAERSPATVVVASVVAPAVKVASVVEPAENEPAARLLAEERLLNEPAAAETEMPFVILPLSNMPPRKLPLRTMRSERS